MTLSIQTDRALIRAATSSTRFVLARVSAPAAPARETRLPVNIALVLDRSGSMEGDRKFALAQEAVEQSLRMLRAEDRFSLVVYDTHIDVLTPSTHATPEARRAAIEALRAIGPRGGTDLGEGWLAGCEQIAQFLDAEGVSRCLLLTDGLANHGITDRDDLARHAGELRQRGVVTSTFGVGADFDERLLRDMAHEGGGNFYFIEGAAQIPEILTAELGEALEVTMRQASLTVALPPGATAETLNRFRQTTIGDRNELRVDLGDLVSTQDIDVVIRLTFPRGDAGAETSATFSVATAGDTVAGSTARQTWTWASHHDNDVQPRIADVDRAVAEIYAARARAEATEANRNGDYNRARHVLNGTARRITEYAGNDEVLRRLAALLREQVRDYAEAPMTAVQLKMSMYSAEVAEKSRDYMGRARRGTPRPG